jgi:hypothetical protein
MAAGVLRPVEESGLVDVVVTCTSDAVDQVAAVPGVKSVRRVS